MTGRYIPKRYTQDDFPEHAETGEGIRCDVCGFTVSRSVRTEQAEDMTRRVRVCLGCGSRFYSTERFERRVRAKAGRPPKA